MNEIISLKLNIYEGSIHPHNDDSYRSLVVTGHNKEGPIQRAVDEIGDYAMSGLLSANTRTVPRIGIVRNLQTGEIVAERSLQNRLGHIGCAVGSPEIKSQYDLDFSNLGSEKDAILSVLILEDAELGDLISPRPRIWD